MNTEFVTEKVCFQRHGVLGEQTSHEHTALCIDQKLHHKVSPSYIRE